MKVRKIKIMMIYTVACYLTMIIVNLLYALTMVRLGIPATIGWTILGLVISIAAGVGVGFFCEKVFYDKEEE